MKIKDITSIILGFIMVTLIFGVVYLSLGKTFIKPIIIISYTGIFAYILYTGVTTYLNDKINKEVLLISISFFQVVSILYIAIKNIFAGIFYFGYTCLGLVVVA